MGAGLMISQLFSPCVYCCITAVRWQLHPLEVSTNRRFRGVKQNLMMLKQFTTTLSIITTWCEIKTKGVAQCWRCEFFIPHLQLRVDLQSIAKDLASLGGPLSLPSPRSFKAEFNTLQCVSVCTCVWWMKPAHPCVCLNVARQLSIYRPRRWRTGSGKERGASGWTWSRC